MSSESIELIVGRKVLERFRRKNAERHAQGDRLREAIRALDEAHPGPKPLRVSAILAQLPPPATLGREGTPSLTTIKRHLRAIRAARRSGPPL